MRVAVLSLRDPVPVYTGLLERTYQMCRYIGEQHDVRVYFPFEPERKRTEDGRIPDEQPFERVGLRSQAIDVLEQVIPDYSPLKGVYHLHPWLYGSLRSRIRDYNPDAVVVECPYLVPLARAVCRDIGATMVMSEHNVEYKLAQRLDIPLWQLLRRYELFTCSKVDAVLTVSEEDRDTLSPHLNGNVTLDVAPNGVDVERYSPRRRQDAEEFRARYGLTAPVLVFHGNLGNAQNSEVVELLIEDVFPAIKDAYDAASLLLIGADPPESTPPGVVVTGLVDDLPGHLAAADVAVAPMRSASGTNLKILEYLATGVPVVTTPVGAEGLPLEHDRTAAVAPADEIAEETVRVLNDDSLRERLRTEGRDLVVEEFSWSATLEPYEAVIQEHAST